MSGLRYENVWVHEDEQLQEEENYGHWESQLRRETVRNTPAMHPTFQARRGVHGARTQMHFALV
jgi:hypothetical protein